MNTWSRLAWPVGCLVVWAATFAGLMSTERFGEIGWKVNFGAEFLAVEFDDLRAGGPMRPIRLPVGARARQDAAYGSHRLQTLDVYIPPGVSGPPEQPPGADGVALSGLSPGRGAPILFMVHGGGWRRGDKASRDVVQNKINFFLPKGYVFVSVNYRLSPETDPTEQAEDVGVALAYVQRHAALWGGDPDRIVVMGHSAGAYLVTMLTSAPDIVQRAGVKSWLGTVSLDSAAYNVVELMQTRHRAFYDRAFGTDPRFWELASPALRLRSEPPPMLLVCSTLWTHSCQQAAAYADAVRAVGGDVTLERVVLRHGAVNRHVGLPGRLTDVIVDFMAAIGLH